MKNWTAFLVLILAGCALGQDNFDQFNEPPKRPAAQPSENIALGAQYTLEPRPDYSYCTDPDDTTQLTDGVYSEGYFWVQKSTVGWRHGMPAIITLDLGKEHAVRGVSYHTAAGRAGVAWPMAILIYVAGEDRQFREAGELVALSAKRGLPAPEEYTTHRYWTDELKTHGRYVALVVYAQPYAFVDEIEIYAGEPDWVNLPLEGEPVADIKQHTKGLLILGGVKRRLRSDVEAVRAKTLQAEIPEGVRRGILAELDAVALAVDQLPADAGEDFRAVLPLDPLHERVFRAQAKLWQAVGRPALTVWQSGLWDPLSHVADPPRESGAAVRVDMMLNEYRAGAFNISNAAQEDVAVEMEIVGVPGGVNPDYITVHEVLWTDTNAGVPVAAALPKARKEGDAYMVGVPSGLTRQVWLTFHPTDLEPATCQGRIELKAGEWGFEVPVTLKVYPLRFPDKPALHFGGWDYTNTIGHYEVTAENRELLVAHLRERFVDSPWATSAVLPRGEYDDTGEMTAAPDTANFDAWLELWPDAGQYCVFASVGSTFGNWKTGTPEFEKAVQAWAAFWAAHAREKGVDPGQLALLLVDEPHSLEQDAVILAWAKVIRAANTGIRIWEDPTYIDMTKANQEMVAACHVLCPNRPIFLRTDQSYRDYFAKQRQKGIALELYSCSGPARLLDPYGYYRLQAWTCWQHGAEATYFWALADAGGAPSWNEYAAKRNAYTPLFIDATSVTAGKHMEACREGVEDFECFVMLRDAIAEAEAKGVESESLNGARKLLTELPGRVCEAGATDSFRWSEDIDRTVADKARVEVLDALVALGKLE